MKNVFDKELSFYSSRIRSLMQEKGKWSVSNQDLFHACHTLKGLCLAAELKPEAEVLHFVEESMLDKDEKKFKKIQSQLLGLVEQLYQKNSPQMNVEDFLDEFSGRVSKQLSKKVSIKFEDQTPDFLDVFGEYSFKRLMIHLLINAIHHGIETPRERNISNKCSIGTIVVKIYNDNENYLLSISDDGRGFGSSESTSTNLFSGRHQGLFIVENLLKSYEGEVEVISDKNFGSTILCKLPTVKFERREKKTA